MKEGGGGLMASQKGGRGNVENLTANVGLTPEQMRERNSKAGKASVKARRVRKTAREEMLNLLQCVPQLDTKTIMSMQQLGMKGQGRANKYTLGQIARAALLQNAMHGDVGANRLVLEISGEDAKTLSLKAQMEHEKELVQMAQTAESDGFMDALKGAAGEVFANGMDEPQNAEDTITE